MWVSNEATKDCTAKILKYPKKGLSQCILSGRIQWLIKVIKGYYYYIQIILLANMLCKDCILIWKVFLLAFVSRN